MRRRAVFRFRGREVTSAPGKFGVAAVLFFGVTVWLALGLVLSPVLVAVHYVLKARGRRGFTVPSEGGFEIKFDGGAFRKVA